MRRYPADIPTAYEADWGQEWTHLFLTYVMQVPAPASWQLMRTTLVAWRNLSCHHLYVKTEQKWPIACTAMSCHSQVHAMCLKHFVTRAALLHCAPGSRTPRHHTCPHTELHVHAFQGPSPQRSPCMPST